MVPTVTEKYNSWTDINKKEFGVVRDKSSIQKLNHEFILGFQGYFALLKSISLVKTSNC